MSVSAARLTNPMRPPAGFSPVITEPAATEVKTSDWKLRAVIQGERDLAIIDGVPVAVGEKYQGATLNEVHSDHVVMHLSNGHKLVLQLTAGVQKSK